MLMRCEIDREKKEKHKVFQGPHKILTFWNHDCND